MGRNLSKEPPKNSELILYQTEDGKSHSEVRFEGYTVWLSQKQLADLFQKDVRTISEHLRNGFHEGELQEDSVIRKFQITAADGKSYETLHYNLNVIIFVGYRVKSLRGTQFRMWATERLREYIVKGFTLDDDRLKQAGGGIYFEEWLERIRDIRSSDTKSKLFPEPEPRDQAAAFQRATGKPPCILKGGEEKRVLDATMLAIPK